MAELPEVARDLGRDATVGLPAEGPLTVGFIGSGRAAGALSRGLRRKGHHLLVATRGATAARLAADVLGQQVPPAEVLAGADVILLAVPDGVIADVAAELAGVAPEGAGQVVAHLAGSMGREVLAPLAGRGYATAAMHPLQVLSGWRIPPGTRFTVDAAEPARASLRRLIADLGGEELDLPDGARTAYHAAAVVAANLGMTLLAEAVDLMARAGVDREQALQGLAGLARGGLEASVDRGLPAALTGPVTRGDVATLRAHLDLLRDDPELLAAYRAVSRLALRQAQLDGRPAHGLAEAVTRLLEENQ
jgi:predicted short-subunit dehydrogenase-like oxidoreductase (DUF2520 family)